MSVSRDSKANSDSPRLLPWQHRAATVGLGPLIKQEAEPGIQAE